MPTGTPQAATRAEVARYGHVAAALRAVLKQRGWSIADFNEAIGRERSYTPAGKWFGAKAAPGPKMRPIVAKATGLTEAQLVPRRPGEEALPVTTAPMLALEGPAAPPPAPRPVLVFNVLEDASIELELRKVRLPIEEGSALLRLLLDAGVVLRKPA